MAWYHAVPIDPKGKIKNKARSQTHEVKLPDVSGLEHIISLVIEAGIYSHGANGPVTITYQELKAWCDLIGYSPDPWVIEAIRHCSTEYCAFLVKARDPHLGAPYMANSTDCGKIDVEKKLDNIIAMRSKK